MRLRPSNFIIPPASAPIFFGAFLCLFCALHTLAKAEPEQCIRFLSYNVKNYLSMQRQGELRPKPASEISALMEIIVHTKPDIIGLSEIGTIDDLKDIQGKLKARGLNLPHSHLTGGSDPVRHLAILSRYPFGDIHKNINLDYKIQGYSQRIRRGIIDTEVLTPIGHLRILGVHLKSKRPTAEFDQALIRRNEAHLLRQHINKILNENPETKLLVHGDFNDTKASTTLHYVKYDPVNQQRLEAMNLSDDKGEKWTHYWNAEDVYSRFDWILYNKALKPNIQMSQSKIIARPMWYRASDHRPLLLTLCPTP